jgi:formate dehydrogenase accessory protein FdhE
MSFLTTGRVNYRARLERAALLSKEYSFAKEVLGFYGHVTQFQKDFYERLPKLREKGAVLAPGDTLRVELNLTVLLEPFKQFLTVIESQSPGPLSAHAHEVRMRGQFAWQDVLADFWQKGLMEAETAEPLTEFLARAFLQPYAEFLAGMQLPPSLPMTVCRCPRCNSLPLLGVLRQEGDGGKRFLQCSFCSQEWDFRRIFCAHCGEEQEQKLPVYVAEQFPHIRVECCDTCKYFLRTIDLTKDGNAVPMVDDLAAIPLSLWAQEDGYTRIQGNLLGT